MFASTQLSFLMGRIVQGSGSVFTAANLAPIMVQADSYRGTIGDQFAVMRVKPNLFKSAVAFAPNFPRLPISERTQYDAPSTNMDIELQLPPFSNLPVFLPGTKNGIHLFPGNDRQTQIAPGLKIEGPMYAPGSPGDPSLSTGSKERISRVRGDMTNKTAPRYYDATVLISESTIVFPGDPTFTFEAVRSLEGGDEYNLRQLHMGNHMGTHVDFPAHVLKDGATSNDFPVERLVGDGVVVEIPDSETVISRDHLKKYGKKIREMDIVLFKTSNSRLWSKGEFTSEFVYLDPSAAEWLREKRVGMVGIDYLSIDGYDAVDLPVHRLLLSRGILIIEALNLKNVLRGRCRVFCLPLNVSNMDGLPARVIVEK